MNIALKGTHIEITPAIEAHVRSKVAMIERLINERGDRVAFVHVEVGKASAHHRQGDIYNAEISVLIGGETHRAAVETVDLYAAVDQAKDKLVDQLARHHDKKVGLFRKGARAIKSMVKGTAVAS